MNPAVLGQAQPPRIRDLQEKPVFWFVWRWHDVPLQTQFNPFLFIPGIAHVSQEENLW